MVNPVHKVKRLVVDEDGTRHWVEEEIVGWLSTETTDANGRAIFEGDRLKVNFTADDFYIETVEFDDSVFKCGGNFLTNIDSLDMEVVGHVTEEGEE